MKIGVQNIPSVVNLPYKDGLKPVRIITCEMTEAQDLQEIEWYSQPGEDAAPPVGSRVLIIEIGDDWKIGFACDDGIAAESLDGEHENYASSGGQKVSSIKQDVLGAIIIQASLTGSATSIKMNTDGSIEINGLVANIKLNVDGSVEISGNTDAPALGSKVDSLWLTLVTALDSFVPVPQDGGAALAKTMSGVIKGSPSYQNTSSLKLKLGG